MRRPKFKRRVIHRAHFSAVSEPDVRRAMANLGEPNEVRIAHPLFRLALVSTKIMHVAFLLMRNPTLRMSL